jgi:hypothetical protein
MEAPPRYQPLSRDEVENLLTQNEDKDGTAWDSNSTEIIPTNTLLVMDNGRMRVATHNSGKTLYSR